MSTAEIRRHWGRVAALGCVISQRPNPTLHHIHGGSCRDVGLHRSMGRKTSDWLVIPLDAEYHTGRFGIDVGNLSVKDWEQLYGRQVDMLDGVCRALHVNLWMKAGLERDPWSSTVAALGKAMKNVWDL